MSAFVEPSAFATGNSVRGPVIALPPGRVVEMAYVSPSSAFLDTRVYHSADTNRDYRIDLQELQRVIELYNTRFGTIRTGAYKVDPSTVDGFAPDPTRPGTPNAVLSKYHSADVNQDGEIDLFELTDVIAIYNYSLGGVRTGQYHVDQSVPGGFRAGPG